MHTSSPGAHTQRVAWSSSFGTTLDGDTAPAVGGGGGCAQPSRPNNVFKGTPLADISGANTVAKEPLCCSGHSGPVLWTDWHPQLRASPPHPGVSCA